METNIGTGSGFMITETGLCFTCFHVIKNANEIFVGLLDKKGKKQVYKAEVVLTSEDNDFAVLQLLNCNNCYFYHLETDFTKLKTGDDVAIYGYPFGVALNDDVMELAPSLTKGYISSKNKINGHDCYFLDINSAPGFSGGPVFSLNNKKVIGYLCGSYGTNRADIIYIRTLETFIKGFVK